MGCAASKVEHEDTVRRCKERRRHIKDAVAARQLLASAHADYLRSLRVTAAALSRFAQGHPSLAVSHNTAPVLLSAAALPPATAHALPTPAPSTAASSSLPPLTPLSQHPNQPPPPVRAAAAAPAQPKPVRAPRPRRLRVPHILSDSSVASPAQSSFRKQPVVGTPSSSSAWDWENFYPPSPPDSEFFERRKADMEEANRLRELEEEEKARACLHHLHPHNLKEEDEVDEDEEDEKEGMHCDGWEDDEEHYASTTTSETRSEEDGVMGTRSECGFAARSECGYVARSKYGGTAPLEYTAVQLPLRRDERSEAGDSSSTVTAVTEMRMVVRHRTLAEIVAAIEEYFVKAADSGNGVSELLEASRAQLDRNFQQLKSTVICRIVLEKSKCCHVKQAQSITVAVSLNSMSFLLQRRCTILTVCSQHCHQHGHQSLHWLYGTSWTQMRWRQGQWKGRAMDPRWSNFWLGRRSSMRKSR
jgi:hypothetical protein